VKSVSCKLHSTSVSNQTVVEIDESKSLSDCVREFKRDGVTILPMKINPDFVEKSKQLATEAWKDGLRRAKLIKGHEMKVGLEHGFQEMVQRAVGRYDMQWKVDGEKHFLDEENVLSIIQPFVYEILGGKEMTRLLYNGLLMGVPGAAEQLWHADGEHLFTSETDFSLLRSGNGGSSLDDRTNVQTILPAHVLNIFIPLVDVEAGNGGTEFCLGSHFLNKFSPDDVVWQDNAWKERVGHTEDSVGIKVQAGDILAFDFRVLHRALEHRGKLPRPILYYTYSKRWFTDAMNLADLPSLHDACD